MSHILFEENLFEKLLNSDLLEFTCQKAHELSNMERMQ